MKPICTKPWTSLYVTSDGNCWNCCYQIKPFHTVRGDSPPFEKVWNNKNIQHIRDKLLGGKMPTDFCDCLNKRGSIPHVDTPLGDSFIESVPNINFVQLQVPKLKMDPRDRFIKRVTGGEDFAEIGGLWGTVNEKVSVAARAGAASLTMIDMIPMQDDLWSKFRKRMQLTSAHVSCLSQNFLEISRKFDVVHCSGVVYHCPNFCESVRHLNTITGKYLILSSVIIPNTIENEKGILSVKDNLYIPEIAGNDKEILRCYWQNIDQHHDAIGITTQSDFQRTDFAPFWWLPTVAYFRKTAEDSGFLILDEDSLWDGNAHTLLLTQTKDDRREAVHNSSSRWQAKNYEDALVIVGVDIEARRRLLSSAANSISGGSVCVDFGCGIGVSTSMLKEVLGDKSVDLIGCDYSQSMLEHARCDGARFVLSNDVLPFGNESVDYICSFDVCIHASLTELRNMFGEFDRVLKRKGMMWHNFLNVENEDAVEASHSASKVSFPLYCYSYEKVWELARENGFQARLICGDGPRLDCEFAKK